MNFNDKIMENMKKIIQIDGFVIISNGDAPNIQWEVKNSFYFDNDIELEKFRNELMGVFENYCGNVEVYTIEEYKLKKL